MTKIEQCKHLTTTGDAAGKTVYCHDCKTFVNHSQPEHVQEPEHDTEWEQRWPNAETPQPELPKREWVGLTDEEMFLHCPNWLSQEHCKTWLQQIEAKLKEKNT